MPIKHPEKRLGFIIQAIAQTKARFLLFSSSPRENKYHPPWFFENWNFNPSKQHNL
jgi:hypothetical protein